MHLIPDTPLVPDTSSHTSTSDITSMPDLIAREDGSILTLSTVNPDEDDQGLWGSLPSSVQFSDPPAPSLPALDLDDGRQGPIVSSAEDQTFVPLTEHPIIDATNVRPGEAIDSDIQQTQIPNEININGDGSESFAILSATSSVRSPREEDFHTVTRRGRQIRKPSRYREPETQAIHIASNYYSVFDIEGPLTHPLTKKAIPFLTPQHHQLSHTKRRNTVYAGRQRNTANFKMI